MEDKKEEGNRGPGLKKPTFYDPGNPSYETHHVCILLGELEREAEENGTTQGEKEAIHCERRGNKAVE